MIFNEKKGLTVWEWMGISESDYDEEVARGKISHKCVVRSCHTRRYRLADNLCPKCRDAYNKWAQSRLEGSECFVPKLTSEESK